MGVGSDREGLVTAGEDAMQDEGRGRANVGDTPELLAYYRELEGVNAGGLWTVANDIEPWFPQPKSVPVIWRYREMRPLVMRATELVTPEKAARRVVMLVNPGRRDVSACVGSLYTGIQVMLPGEAATAHRHTASALRFVMEGAGAYTVVDHEKLHIGARDLVLTPSWTWHDHGNEGTSGPTIWQDGLDIPLVNALEVNFFEVYPGERQTPTRPVNASYLEYGGNGLCPTWDHWTKPYSPLTKYPWEPTYEALRRAAREQAGSPYDAVLMEYVNPRTGGPIMSTMGASIQLLRPGEQTRAHRHTGNVVYQVAKGHGYSVIGGQRFDWEEKDIFVVPTWTFHEHANGSASDDAVLFSFNDLPTMRALAVYREEELVENGGQQPVAREMVGTGAV
jgi:gentisate 1,2-dioxygenase